MTRLFARASTTLAASLAALLSAPASAQQSLPAGSSTPATILVLDVSNSMWGQIDGVSKIEIARDVIGGLVGDLQDAGDIGLVAYGHRREGDCGDIQTVIPVGPLDPTAFTQTVNGLVPRGKTPLTDAVRAAAEALNYRDVPATVILVSDGVESCGKDPCALGAELERAGLGFTAHVVGFDVGRVDQEGLSCLAENTGGLYLTADDADELSEALRVVAAPPAATLTAVETAGGPPVSAPVSWTVVNLDTEADAARGQSAVSLTLPLEPGLYLARATGTGVAGTAQFEFAGEDMAVEVVLAPDVTVSPPAEAEINTEMAVGWTGPDAPGDYLAVAVPGAPVTAFESYARTSGGAPATLTVPGQAGAYEVRYVDAARARILATAPFRATPPDVGLEGPGEADAGSEIEVTWRGPGADGDYITIVPEGAPASAAGPTARLDTGSPVAIVTPEAAGPHSIRYIAAGGAVLAEAPLALVIPVTLTAPPTIVSGAKVPVGWQGPDNDGDLITIVMADAPDDARGDVRFTTWGNPAEPVAPLETGQAEIRYLSGESKTVLARLPITLTEPEVTLSAPPAVVAGARVSVDWVGPDNPNDFITIVMADASDGDRGDARFTTWGNPSEPVAPQQVGQAEIRYMAKDGTVLARLPITLTAPEITLTAPPAVVAGATVTVDWIGPDNPNDIITIVMADAPDGERGDPRFTTWGNPAKAVSPRQVGQAEIRYMAKDGTVLARLPITLTDASVTLAAPPAIVAGATVPVEWEGPDNGGDYITIVMADTPDGKFAKYTYTNRGKPLPVVAPLEEGQAEIRYMAKDGTVLARLPITLTEPQVTLAAPPAMVAGATVPVEWEGPDNGGDYITIVMADTPDGKFAKYTYTNRGTPLPVLSPPEAGQAEIRYMAKEGKVLARLPLTLTEPQVTLEAPPAVTPGAKVQVTWTGPNNDRDYITIVPAGTPEGKFAKYNYTNRGETIPVEAPFEPGQAEIRYVSGQSQATLARLPITIRDIEISLDPPPAASAGSLIDVTWAGPDADRDRIFVGAADHSGTIRLDNSRLTSKGSPLTVLTPDVAGDYAVHYVTRQGKILASVPITLTETPITMDFAPSAPAGEPLQVTWTGPDNPKDRIFVSDVDRQRGVKLDHSRRTEGGPTLSVPTPKTPGAYEVRYISGQTNRVMARVPLTLE